MSRPSPTAALVLGAVAAPFAVLAAACVDETEPHGPGTYGYVMAQQGIANIDGGVDPSGFAFASYYELPPASNPCQSRVVGPCTVSVCPALGPRAPIVSTFTAKNAGTIAVSGGLQPVALAPIQGGDYASFFSTGPLWEGGETLTFQAAGADIAGYTVTAIAPAQVTILEPRFLPGSTLSTASTIYTAFDGSAPCPPWLGSTLSRASDWTLRWSGGTPSTELTVDLGVGFGEGSCSTGLTTTSARCTFDAATGVGVVPAAVLGAFPQDVTGVLIEVGSTRFVNALGWSTQITASAIAVDSTGAAWNGYAGTPLVLLQ